MNEGALDLDQTPAIVPFWAPSSSAVYRPGAIPVAAGVVAPEDFYWVGNSDANGNYAIPTLPYGNYVLVYTLPGDFNQTVGGPVVGAITIVVSTPETEQDIAGADYSDLIQNQVVLQSDQSPISFCDALLRWSASDGVLHTEDDVLFPVRCDENGMFQVHGLVSGSYDIETLAADPLVAIPKPVDLDQYSIQDGGIWELIPRPELASTGFDPRSLTLAASSVFAAGLLAAAVTRRRRGEV